MAFAAGSWSAALTARGIEQLAYGGLPVVPRIFFSVRDERWRSPDVVLGWQPAGERIATALLSGLVAGYPIAVRGDISVSDGLFCVTFILEVTSEVAVSRAGPCVLFELPPAGSRIVTDRSAVDADAIEDVVSPRPLVSGFTRLEMPTGGALVALDLGGVAYEMEDQRNWGDATLKAYCPPLDVERPLHLEPGTAKQFTLTFRLDRPADERTGHPHQPGIQVKPVELTPGPEVAQRPSLGLTHPGGPLDDGALSQIAEAAPAFLHLLVDLGAPDWSKALSIDLAVAAALGARAVLTVECPDDQQLAALATQCAGAVDIAFVFRPYETTTADALAERARQAFGGSGLRVGGGSRGHFASTNVDGGVPDAVEVVAVPLAGAAHDDDRRALTTGPGSFAAVIASARRLAPGRELYVGPVGLSPTFDSWSPPGVAAPIREAWDWGHRRHSTAFGAAWAIAAYAALAPLGLERVCIAGTVGGRGLGQPSAEGFTGYPILSALRQLNALDSDPVAALPAGGRVAGLVAPRRAVLAVMTDSPWSMDSRWPELIASATLDPAGRRPDGSIQSPDVVTLGDDSGTSVLEE